MKGRAGVIFRYLEKNSEGNDLQESVMWGQCIKGEGTKVGQGVGGWV